MQEGSGERQCRRAVEEGSAGGQWREAVQEGRCSALSRPCPTAREEHRSDRPSSGCFLRQKNVGTEPLQ